MNKKVFACLLAVVMLLGLIMVPAAAKAEGEEAKNIVILYTNDAHCGITDGMGYVGVARVKAAYEAAGKEVILVDNGDALQGDIIGTLSKEVVTHDSVTIDKEGLHNSVSILAIAHLPELKVCSRGQELTYTLRLLNTWKLNHDTVSTCNRLDIWLDNTKKVDTCYQHLVHLSYRTLDVALKL